MNSDASLKSHGKISSLLNSGKCADAFAELRTFAAFASQTDRLREVVALEQRYFFMLRFMAQGHTDPDMDAESRDILFRARFLADMIYRDAVADDNSGLYYSVLRFRRLRPDETLASLAVDYLTELSSLSQDSGALLDSGRREGIERLSRDIFNAVWTEFPLSDDDSEALENLISDTQIPLHDRENWISALWLGLLNFYDPARVVLLAKAYMLSDRRLSLAALTGLAVASFRFRKRRLDDKSEQVLATLADLPGWKSDLAAVVTELMRSLDTERITRKMKEDILPGMMKMSSQVMEKLKDVPPESQADIETLAENPEWDDIIHKDGMFDKLKEMNELQMEGADVFMSTFANMRSFRFFNDIANWFLPYTPVHSSLAALSEGEGALLCDTFAGIPFLCDSDKYAVLCAMAETPGAMRNQAMSRISSQYQAISDNVAEVSVSGGDDSRRQIANNYVKNIYRFFKLFRRKGEFFDPFAKGFSIRGIRFFDAITGDAGMLALLAEFSFKTGLYDDAAEFYSSLASFGDEHLTVSVLQKSGFSYEKTGDLRNAEHMYRRAIELYPDNVWTLRRLASVLRHGGRQTESAQIYSRLVDSDCENLELLYVASLTLIEAGDYARAVSFLQKMNYLEEGSRRSLRPLAWALFLDGKYEESAQVYSKLLAGTPDSNDYLNNGHVMLALRRTRDALFSYKASLGKSPDAGALRNFVEAMDADREYLSDAGVDESAVARMIDAVEYAIRPSDFGIPFI